MKWTYLFLAVELRRKRFTVLLNESERDSILESDNYVLHIRHVLVIRRKTI